jgi:hypothetical protein
VFLSLAVLLILLVSQAQVQPVHSASLPSSAVGLSGTRSVPLTIKIVFIGIQSTDINTTYLTSIVNLPSQKSQIIQFSSQGSGGVTFDLTYQESFANSSVVSGFASYLGSIQRTVNTLAGPPSSTNPPQNPYFNDSTTDIGTVTNTFYNAGKVESWLNSATSFGPSPVPGYTLYIADLSNYIPSFTFSQYQSYNTKCTLPTNCSDPNRGAATPHYYNTTVVDQDLGLNQPRHFMTGWGGDNRSYFIDLSAGPSYWSMEQPLDVAQQVRGVNSQPYLLNWRTQYVADYIVGAVYNLFAPDQLYPVSYSAKYVFDLFIIDARTPSEILNGPAIKSTVNIPIIQSQLSSLVPFATVTINPKFMNLTSSPGLDKVVTDATTTIHDPAANDTVVDARLVYNWLSVENHVTQFVNAIRTTDEIDIPEFIFAFSGDHDFGFTSKGDVFLNQPDSIFGVSLGDMVLISHGQRDLTTGSDYIGTGYTQPGKGVGFTRTIVHESGHELGLVHPFMYDIDEDFVNSVMAYYPNVNSYSQFDRDLELRGINDELLLYAQVTLAGTTSTLLNAASISAARQAMSTAEVKYNAMDYAGAVAFSLSAATNAASAQQGSGLFSNFNGSILYLVVGILLGAAIGLVLGFLAFRKRTPGGLAYYHCPTCGRPLRWDPAMMRWYCDYCQKPV